MTGAVAASNDAVHVKVPEIDLGLTDRALAVIERIWVETLHWCSQNQLDFVAILIFLAFCIHEKRVGRTEVQRMKNEFETIRGQNKAPELPLPEPVQRPQKDGM